MPIVKTNPWTVVHTARFKLPNYQGEYVKVCLQNVDTNELVVKYMENPRRSFWISKKPLRTPGTALYHNYKKECEKIEYLDRYECANHEMASAIFKALGQRAPYKPTLKMALKSPHVYGADVDIEVLIKKHYNDNCKGTIGKTKAGFIDIEVSLLPQTMNQIIISSYVDYNRNLFISVDRTFLKPGQDDEYITKHVIKRLVNLVNKDYKITINYFNTEKEVIEDTFKNLHASDISVCGIWNIDYDLPTFIRRMGFLGLDSSRLFNGPNVPEKYNNYYYHKDESKTAHITDKWCYCTTGGKVIFLDSMCLYSRIRKTSGRKSSYNLGYITSQEIDLTKLAFGKELGHIEMQRDHFDDYIAYGGLDPSLMLIMEEKNNDILGLINMIGNSRLQDYPKSTTMLKDDFYGYYLDNGYIGATASSDMKLFYDHLLVARGGAVLPTDRYTGTGLCLLEEAPDKETLVSRGVADVDLKALYPSILMAFNISKATKLSTCIGIEGYGSDIYEQEKIIEKCFGWMVTPEVNAVKFCNEFLNLPDLSEMADILDKELDCENDLKTAA